MVVARRAPAPRVITAKPSRFKGHRNVHLMTFGDHETDPAKIAVKDAAVAAGAHCVGLSLTCTWTQIVDVRDAMRMVGQDVKLGAGVEGWAVAWGIAALWGAWPGPYSGIAALRR